MTARVRPSSRQGTLFPATARDDDNRMMDANPELVEALADLLLEALGEDPKEEGGGDESEDHG